MTDHPRTLLEKVSDGIRFNAIKHGLWKQDGFDNVEDYIEATINRRKPFELLQLISDALEDI